MIYRISIYTYVYQNSDSWNAALPLFDQFIKLPLFKNIKNKTKKRNSDTCKVTLLSYD